MTRKWQDTDNGARTMQSIARNLEKLTARDEITPRDLFAAAALCGSIAKYGDEQLGAVSMFTIGAWEMADEMMEARGK